MVGDEPNLRTYYYHTDHLGSIRAVSNSNGNIVGLYTYDPFGNVIQEVSYPDADRLRFTGKRLDATGLYYFNARYYDPTLGRFISADPARQGLNWYVYCNNNPLMFVDPDGRQYTQDVAIKLAWLPIVDTVLPIGDIVYVVTVVAVVACEYGSQLLPVLPAAMVEAFPCWFSIDGSSDLGASSNGSSGWQLW